MALCFGVRQLVRTGNLANRDCTGVLQPLRWKFALAPRAVGVLPQQEVTEEKVIHVGILDRHLHCKLAIVVGKKKRFIIQPDGVSIGDVLLSSKTTDKVEPRKLRPGNRFRVGSMPPGTQIHDIEVRPGEGGEFCRTNGCGAHILAHDEDAVRIVLPSKKTKKFNPLCFATVGKVADYPRRPKGKAGTPAVPGRKWPK